MSPQDPLKYLQSLTGLGIRTDLAPFLRVLARFHHPERRCRTVLIAGTNGKGSIAAMVSAVLTKAGLKTGLYTSPHIISFRERIRVDGKMISRGELRDLIETVRLRIGEELTYFEFSTLLAFLHFHRCRVDAAVLEVGMGGRFDATNVATPEVSVISNISMEHRDFLGRSLEAIAREKGGIIKAGGICLTAARQKVVWKVLEDICALKGARLYRLGRDFRVRRKGQGVFSFRGIYRNYDHIAIPLKGEHQIENAALALGVIEILASGGLEIGDEAITGGLMATRWEGRLEVLGRSPTLVVDGAHNPAGMGVLRNALSRDFTYRRLILIFGVLRDKDYRAMLRKIAHEADLLILTRPGNTDRALPPEALEGTARKYNANVFIAKDPEDALREAINIAGERDLICAAGSLYLVGAIKQAYRRMKIKTESKPPS